MRHLRHLPLLGLLLFAAAGTAPGTPAATDTASVTPAVPAAAGSYEFREWLPFPDASSGRVASSTAKFLPRSDCKTQLINEEQMALTEGAMLVRPGKEAVFVSQNVAGQKIMTRITRGALTLFSAAGGNCMVINLSGRCCGAVVVYPPSAAGKGSASMQLGPGQMAELHPLGAALQSTAFAAGTISEKQCTDNVALLLSRCDLPKVVAVCNLQPLLEPAELESIAKISAAGQPAQSAKEGAQPAQSAKEAADAH